jgi:hypothetical protein
VKPALMKDVMTEPNGPTVLLDHVVALGLID